MSNTKLFCGKLMIRKSSIHGYGVFAAQNFQPGDLIETCYLLIRADKDKSFANYYYWIDDQHEGLALGYGSIYNHAECPNADFSIDAENKLLFIKATKPIICGEEIFISYGKDWFLQHTI